jgi:hypothetical protein
MSVGKYCNLRKGVGGNRIVVNTTKICVVTIFSTATSLCNQKDRTGLLYRKKEVAISLMFMIVLRLLLHIV